MGAMHAYCTQYTVVASRSQPVHDHQYFPQFPLGVDTHTPLIIMTTNISLNSLWEFCLQGQMGLLWELPDRRMLTRTW